MYNLVNFVDHTVQYPLRKKITDRGDGTVDIVSEPGEIIRLGTAQCASTFNPMDRGISDAQIAEQVILQYFINFERFTRQKMNDHDAEFTPEIGEVTLTNTAKYPFNNSGSTVALVKLRKTMNYDLFIEVQTISGGEVGSIEVYDKQLNGFKIRYTGSASNVKIKYRVRGGIIV